MTIFTLVGIALVGVSATIVIKAYRPDIAVQASIALGIVLLIAAMEPLSEVFSEINAMVSEYGLNSEYIKLMIKIVGLAYLTRFAADICTDSGESALGNRVELCGRLMIMTVCVPVVIKILSTVSELIRI